MHRHALWLTVIAAIGCKGKTETVAATGSGSGSAVAKTESGSGSGSGSGSMCFPLGNDGILESFTADDKAATFCIKLVDHSGADKPATEKCMAVDLASGVYTETKPPAKPAPATTYKQDPTGVQACTAGKCVTLELPKLPKPPAEESQSVYTIDASPDGKKLVATGNEMKGVAIVDAATGKKLKTIAIGDHESECLVDAHYVGETIYVLTSVCAGPGGMGYLFSGDGKLLAKMETEDVNVYGNPPIRVDGDQWAFADFNGGTYMIWDVKAAKHVRTVKIESIDCADCSLLGGESIHVTPLAKTPAGKLVTISAEGVTVTDPKTGKTEPTRKMPMCAPAKAQ